MLLPKGARNLPRELVEIRDLIDPNDGGLAISMDRSTAGLLGRNAASQEDDAREAPLDGRPSALYCAAMNEQPPEPLAFELMCALKAVEARLEGALEPLGLSLAKFGALSKLAAAGEPLPLRTLAERCACVRSNITQLVDRLEAEKLVVRTDDPRDRRSVLAELTAEGRSRHAAGVRALEEADHELSSRVPPDQRDHFLQLIQSLTGA